MNVESGSIRVALLKHGRLGRDSLTAVLRQGGMNVCAECKDGLELVQYLEVEQPDVVVLDFETPQPDLLELVQQVHGTHPEARMLVVAASADPRGMEQCLQAGASGYLNAQSSGVDSLLGAVRSLAQGTHVLPSELVDTLLRVDPRTGAAAHLLSLLSAREREVLGYVAAGADNLKIASLLGISERTVKAHVSSLYRKLSQENRTQLALLARQLGVRPMANV